MNTEREGGGERETRMGRHHGLNQISADVSFIVSEPLRLAGGGDDYRRDERKDNCHRSKNIIC